MKKIVILGLIAMLSFVLLVGCVGNNGTQQTGDNAGTTGETANNSDTASNNAAAGSDATTSLTPPAWLIGEWTPADPVLDNQDILVTNDNVVLNSGLLDIEWQIKNVGLVVEESFDGDNYTITYVIGEMTTTYIFKNQGNNTLILRFGINETLMDMDFIKK